MIVEMDMPVMTTQTPAGEEELVLTSVPLSYDVEEANDRDAPVIASWVDAGGNHHDVRKLNKQDRYVGFLQDAPVYPEKLDVDVYDLVLSRIIEVVSSHNGYCEDDARLAFNPRRMTVLSELHEPDHAMIDRQISLHRADMDRFVIVGDKLYRSCAQPYLALVEADNKFRVEPWLELYGPSQKALAKFDMTDMPAITKWLAANYPSFRRGRNVSAFQCQRPDLFTDLGRDYACYSLIHRFAAGVSNLIRNASPIALTRFLASISEAEATFCLDASLFADPGRMDPSVVDAVETAHGILAISEESALWQAFGQVEFLAGFHQMASQLLDVTPAAASNRIRKSPDLLSYWA